MESDVLFRRLPHPAMDLVDHANKIGIRLKSSGLLQSPGPPRSTTSRHSERSAPVTGGGSRATPLSSRARTTPQRVLPPNTPPIQYIHNIVVPLHAPADELNLSTTTTCRAFSGSRVRSTALSAGVHSKVGRLFNAKTGKPASSSLPTRGPTPRTRSSTTFHSDHQEASTLPSDLASVTHARDAWNHSEQGLRYHREQEVMAHCKTRKRTSETSSTAVDPRSCDPTEVRTHRVDRLYYMSGSGVKLGSKYTVDELELEQLKEMAKARRQAKHYGRGLSRRHGNLTCTNVLDNSEVPRQPPPSSMGDTETVADGLATEDAVINDTRSQATADGEEVAQKTSPAEPEDEGLGMDLNGGTKECEAAASLQPESAAGICQQMEQQVEEVETVQMEGELVVEEEGEQQTGRDMSSLDTQRDSASFPALDSSRHAASLLTEESTARSEPWRGALQEEVEDALEASVEESDAVPVHPQPVPSESSQQEDHQHTCSDDMSVGSDKCADGEQGSNMSTSATPDAKVGDGKEDQEEEEGPAAAPIDPCVPLEPEQLSPEPVSCSSSSAVSQKPSCETQQPAVAKATTHRADRVVRKDIKAVTSICPDQLARKSTTIQRKPEKRYTKSQPQNSTCDDRPLSPCQGH